MCVNLSLQFEGENAALSNMNSYLVKAFEQFKWAQLLSNLEEYGKT